MTFVILLIFILEKRYEIQMNDTETKNTAVKAPALMSISEKMQIFPDIWNMVDTTIRSGQTVLIRRFLPMQTGGCG